MNWKTVYWQDEYGYGKIEIERISDTEWHVTADDDEVRELVGVYRSAAEAQRAAHEAADEREADPDYEGVAAVIADGLDAEMIVRHASATLENADHSEIVWLDPRTGEMHVTHERWRLDAMDWPDHYISLGRGRHRQYCSPAEAARIIVAQAQSHDDAHSANSF